MANELSKVIKKKTDDQLRLNANDNRTRFQEDAAGNFNQVIPTDYQKGVMAGNNITLAVVENNIEITSTTNIVSNDDITATKDGAGAVTLAVIGGSADQLLTKPIDIPTFTGTDGYVLAYNEADGKFYLKVDSGGGGEASKIIVVLIDAMGVLDDSLQTLPAMVTSVDKPA